MTPRLYRILNPNPQNTILFCVLMGLVSFVTLGQGCTPTSTEAIQNAGTCSGVIKTYSSGIVKIPLGAFVESNKHTFYIAGRLNDKARIALYRSDNTLVEDDKTSIVYNVPNPASAIEKTGFYLIIYDVGCQSLSASTKVGLKVENSSNLPVITFISFTDYGCIDPMVTIPFIACLSSASGASFSTDSNYWDVNISGVVTLSNKKKYTNNGCILSTGTSSAAEVRVRMDAVGEVELTIKGNSPGGFECNATTVITVVNPPATTPITNN